MEIIRQQKLYEQVATQLEKMIVGGQYKVKSQLPSERALAEQFGVNRLVIREALRTLEAKKLIKTRMGEGTFVTRTTAPPQIPDTLLRLFAEDQLSVAALDELFMIRRHLELAVIKSAGPNLLPEHFAHLEQCLNGFHEALRNKDKTGISHHDEAFHRGIARGGSGKVLESLVSVIWDIIRKYQQFYFTHCAKPEVVLNYLQKIYENLKAGRIEEASLLMEKILIYGDEDFKALLELKEHHFMKGDEDYTP